MLTGHTKKLFEEWYFFKYSPIELDNYDIDSNDFYSLPFSMRSGVYLEFCREQGYGIEWRMQDDGLWSFVYGKYFSATGFETLDPFEEFNTGFIESIKGCNELINGSEK